MDGHLIMVAGLSNFNIITDSFLYMPLCPECNTQTALEDRFCGKCGARHGGNSHYCAVHGAVSGLCCQTDCNPTDWVFLGNGQNSHGKYVHGVGLVLRSEADLAGFKQNSWDYKPGVAGYEPA